MKKVTVSAFAKRKANNEKIVMITAYDAVLGAGTAAAGIDMLLVGDSVGMTELGYTSTLPVTMEDMLSHACAVRRGAPDSFIVFDMPFMSYQESDEEALHNAGLAMKTTGCDAVKLEGGAEYAGLIRKLTGAGIPVMAHLGLLPQHIQVAGGYKVAGRSEEAAAQLLRDAFAVQEAGAFAAVLECVPEALAAEITEQLTIPTIGIGSGRHCSGEIQVIHDVLGLLEFKPKHAKCYAELRRLMVEALSAYAQEVREGKFPAEENIFQ